MTRPSAERVEETRARFNRGSYIGDSDVKALFAEIDGLRDEIRNSRIPNSDDAQPALLLAVAEAVREACKAEVERLEAEYDDRGVRGSYPADFSDRDKRDAMGHAATEIAAVELAPIVERVTGRRA